MNFLRRLFSVATLLVFVATCPAQNIYFPGSTWERKTPASQGLNSKLIDSAVSFALANEVALDYDLRIATLKAFANEPGYKILGPMKERGKPAGMIIKNGYIVASWGDVERVDMTFSVAKSYLSTMAGLALDEGKIKSLDDRVSNYVWDETFAGPHNSKITWRHLLHQTSDWSGCIFDICDWADRPPRTGTVDDWRNRKLNEPGTVYKYNDVRINVLALSLLQVMRKPLPAILREKIMDPMGASSTWRWYGYENSFVNIDGYWVQSVSGGGHFGGGLFINTMDQARFGLLYARNGRWKDRQLLSSQWVSSVTQPSSAKENYGLLWWTNQDGHLGKISKSVYAAEGFGGNFIVVDSSKDLVVVTRWLDTRAIGRLVDMVIEAEKK